MSDSKEKQITAQEAEEVIDKRNQEIVDTCNKDIQAVLEKHQCSLDVVFELRGSNGSILPRYEIVRR